jgi:hypothetical protein
MRRSILAVLAVLLAAFSASAQSAQHSRTSLAICPETDCVTDEITAVRIAEAVLIPIYGEKHIVGERPFTARLDGARWIVTGTLPRPKRRGDIVVGGTAMVELDKRDGRIVAVYHMK